VSGRTIGRWITAGLLALAVTAVGGAASGQQSDELTRKVKSKVQPVYPDVARRMSIAGIVKVQVVVAPNGSVKSTKLVGGHPLLANAALEAVKKWRFEPAAEETTGVVEFKFDAQQ
jgi:TonB family protein